METIIVDYQLIVNVHQAAIVRISMEIVIASRLDIQGGSPAHGKVIATLETWPSASHQVLNLPDIPGVACLAASKVWHVPEATDVKGFFLEAAYPHDQLGLPIVHTETTTV